MIDRPVWGMPPVARALPDTADRKSTTTDTVCSDTLHSLCCEQGPRGVGLFSRAPWQVGARAARSLLCARGCRRARRRPAAVRHTRHTQSLAHIPAVPFQPISQRNRILQRQRQSGAGKRRVARFCTADENTKSARIQITKMPDVCFIQSAGRPAQPAANSASRVAGPSAITKRVRLGASSGALPGTTPSIACAAMPASRAPSIRRESAASSLARKTCCVVPFCASCMR